MKPQISIIGCGRVGTSLAVFLARAGYDIAGFASRSLDSAEKTAQAVGQGRVFTDAADAVVSGDIVFITTPDNLIEEVCRDLTSGGCGDCIDGKIFYHCSGALSSCILASAAEKGGVTGSIHPLQSFATYEPDHHSPFTGINISVEGDEKAVALGKELINALGASPFSIPTKSKTLYHAAAVVASNYLVTLEDFALQLLKEADLPWEKAYEILEPLIQGTLNNIKNRGTTAALTGPVARGDVQIVENHLRDIDEISPHFSDLYRIMGFYTLQLAQKRGELDGEVVSSMTEIFKKP